MDTVKVWWAGHLLQRITIRTPEDVSEVLDQLREDLSDKSIVFVSCGVRMQPDSLCVDVLDNGKLVACHTVKPSE